MPEQKRVGMASELPLPGEVMRQEQADATLTLWVKLVKVQEHPAYKALLNGLQEERNKLREKMRGEKHPERMREWRLKYLATGLPSDVLTTWLNLAVSAAVSTQETAEKEAERKTAGETDEAVPQDFDNEEKAAQARADGIALDDLVNTDGWKWFSMLIAAHAWALDFFIAHCHESDVAFYQEARRQVVGLLTDVQAAIDHGVDAAAWLSAMAEREKETD